MPADYVVTNRRGCVLGPLPYKSCEYEEYGLHEHTIDQEVRTLHNRHLFATPTPDILSKAWKLFKTSMRRITKRVGRVPRALVKEVIGNRSSMKRRRFGSGMARYCRLGIRHQDSYLTEMQKLEFYAEDKIPVKEDRGIQFRSPTYNAALARHLHHCEHRLYERMRNVDGTPMIAKGRSPLERGLILDAMSSSFVKPVYVLMDHSRFDAHVNKWLLDEEHNAYLRMRNWDPELVQLLNWQKRSMGFSRGGIVYRIMAKRSSGDINTGSGNSLLNLAMILAWLEYARITNYRIFLDGDDSVVIIEDEDLKRVGDVQRSIADFMLKLGMVTEVEIAHELNQAEFCQSRVVHGELGPIMVRNPRKVLDVLTKSPRMLTPDQARGVLAASSLGELMQAPGVPMISVAAAALLTMSGKKPGFTTPDAYERFRVYSTDTIKVEVDSTMRVGFEEAWGISIQEQMAVEAYYSDMADLCDEIPPVKPPKAKPGADEFDTWDDVMIGDLEIRDEDDWWNSRYPLGAIVRRSRV